MDLTSVPTHADQSTDRLEIHRRLRTSIRERSTSEALLAKETLILAQENGIRCLQELVEAQQAQIRWLTSRHVDQADVAKLTILAFLIGGLASFLLWGHA